MIVLYATASTVAELSGEAGVDRLALRLDDPSPDAAEATVEAVRTHLESVPGFNGFANLPQVRAPGDWPGKADTEAFARFLSALTVLALLSAVVLISSTMSTLVAEQTREIGIMRAIGARRRQVAAVYLRTTLLLGGIAALVGAALGILLSSLLARYFGSLFWVVDVGFGVDPTVLAVSLLVGLLAPALAALPAIRRGLRVDLRDALEASGSTFGGQGAADRALRRAGFLPRTMQIGLRNVGRRKRRSLATALIVALAVGNLLAVLGVAAAATEASRRSWSSHLEDLQVSTSGRDLFDAEAEREIRATPGVAEAEPVLKNTVVLNGQEAFVWGVEQEPLLDYRLADGRWFTRAEEQDEELVAVVERNIAQLLGIEVDDDVSIESAAGTADFRVVGLADNQQEDGTAVYIPLTTARALIGLPEGANAYWVRADSSDPAVVDRTTTRLEDRLAALGYEVDTEVSYVAEQDEVAANRSLTTTIGLLGFVIVAMSMVGLANAITTNVLERTREIGIVRCIGARARDVRRIFTTEGVAIAVAGWVIGIPLGYAFDRLLVRLIWEVADVRIPVLFPPANVLVALVGTVVLSLARAPPPGAPSGAVPPGRRPPLRLRRPSPVRRRGRRIPHRPSRPARTGPGRTRARTPRTCRPASTSEPVWAAHQVRPRVSRMVASKVASSLAARTATTSWASSPTGMRRGGPSDSMASAMALATCSGPGAAPPARTSDAASHWRRSSS